VAGDSTNGMNFQNDGNMFIHAKNTNAAQRTLTILTPARVAGVDVADVAVVLPLTTGDKMIGPFDPTIFNQSDGTVNVDLDASAGVTIAVFKL
jgi:hypothetical protein